MVGPSVVVRSLRSDRSAPSALQKNESGQNSSFLYISKPVVYVCHLFLGLKATRKLFTSSLVRHVVNCPRARSFSRSVEHDGHPRQPRHSRHLQTTSPSLRVCVNVSPRGRLVCKNSSPFFGFGRSHSCSTQCHSAPLPHASVARRCSPSELRLPQRGVGGSHERLRPGEFHLQVPGRARLPHEDLVAQRVVHVTSRQGQKNTPAHLSPTRDSSAPRTKNSSQKVKVKAKKRK